MERLRVVSSSNSSSTDKLHSQPNFLETKDRCSHNGRARRSHPAIVVPAGICSSRRIWNVAVVLPLGLLCIAMFINIVGFAYRDRYASLPCTCCLNMRLFDAKTPTCVPDFKFTG